MQASRRSPKIAVLDTIHGGDVIARKMVESGFEAEALEVYHHTSNLAGFDEVAAPVHLWPNNPHLVEARRRNIKIITHHQAVGELIGQALAGMEVFEITGTHSKTSTALLLAMILSQQKRVLSHTTRGLEVWSAGDPHLLKKDLSITPGNVIVAAEAAAAQGAEALICEISLGGTGQANYGILTSLSGDYRIAGASKWASTAKLQMVSLARKGTTLIANTDARISADISFASGGRVDAKPDRLIFGKAERALSLGEDLDFMGYRTAIAAAAAAAWASGMERDEIARSMQDFDGFSGRMKIKRLRGMTYFDNSNSGLKVGDVARALDRAQGSDLAVVVGEDSETVCEGLNIPALADLLRQRRREMAKLILVGKRLEPLACELNADTAKNLAEGLGKAETCGLERLLSCVKCFR
jgi:UDP-N-acetylmuramyl pentapeptide synthase